MRGGQNFPILIIDDELQSDTAGGRALRSIITELKNRDFSVIEALRGSDGKAIFYSNPHISCLLIDWVLGLEVDDLGPVRKELINDKVRKRNRKVPIFIITDKSAVNEIPKEVLEVINGYVWKTEDTPNFIAGRIEHAVKQYLEDISPPFFKKLMQYVRKYKYSWHTPGHSGGVAFLKTAVGKVFFDFFGENTIRADLSVSVPELGSLLEHTEVIGEAEEEAARVFGANRTYFITNGTSTANKIVFHATVTKDDKVIVDRNCHKSVMHAIIMTKAKPIYVKPQRNAYGIIGPISLKEFDNISTNEIKAKLAIITNSTYDGLCYHVGKIIEKLRDKVENILFDEAWYGYAKFHPFYKDRFGMDINDNSIVIYATQSTHKLLAAFSQASMIHVKGNIEHDRFNEAFMMHTSTSPQYGIIASLDVSTRMMDEAGEVLINEALEEAIIFRKKMEEFAKDGLFKIWQPKTVVNRKLEDLCKEPSLWTLKKKNDNNNWHGFKIEDDDYILLDPLKVTILTADLDGQSQPDKKGVPAFIVSRFLRKKGIVVEKTGFYSFLVLFSMGITKGKSGTLISALLKFKKLYYNDKVKFKDVFPELTKQYSNKYKDSIDLKSVCNEMHKFLRGENSKIIHDVYDTLPEKVKEPWEAYEKIVKNEIEKVDIEQAKNKISATMIVPYPPGIPIIMPGEKFSENVVNYLKFCRDFDQEFPGFETEIHGIQLEKGKYKVFVLKERIKK